MESCAISFIKYLLFIFNLFFAISGMGMIAAGAVVLLDVIDFNHFIDINLIGTPIVLIFTGSVVFITAFLGCSVAMRDSFNILIAFTILLLITFMSNLAVSITVSVYKSNFRDSFKTILKDSMGNYTNSKLDRMAWDNVQKKFKCCGVEGEEDWHGKIPPDSCCHEDESLKEPISQYCSDIAIGKFMYQPGCFNKLQTKIDTNTNVLIGVGIGIAFIEIIGIILACWLAYTIKYNKK